MENWEWGHTNFKEVKIPPSDNQIDELLPLVNFRHITINEQKRTAYLANEGMQIGLGGIAKGYAALQAGKELEKKNINNFIIVP